MPADNSAIDPIDPVGPLADEFLARHRRGEEPAVADYAERYPEHAERIRQLFPMLLAMEQAGPDASLGATVAPAVAAPDWTGPRLDRIGGYRLLREVGRGGMGIVYEAEQVALGRHVALKVLPMHAARGGSGLERFRQEAKAAARLHHTNIVPVYEVGQDGDACFYAMQFINGQPLDQVMDEVRNLRAASGEIVPHPPAGASVAHSLLTGLPAPPPSNPQAVPASPVSLPGQGEATVDRPARRTYYRSVARVGVQVAQALDYAHKEGVIHRDVKPSNLLLDADGRVWVTDFGLAKTDGTTLTTTGDIVGTVRYMAPERFNGWSDPRSDVYSLGLTLYEMVALRPAYEESEQMRLMQKVLHEDPAPLHKADPQVPRDLETVIAKATDREPSRRYQSAAEFGADLQRFLDDRPILARRIGVGERAWRWARRNPALAAATALTFAALLTATVVSALFAAAQAEAAAKQKHLSDELEVKRKDAEAERDKSQDLAGRLDVALKETRAHAARSAVDRAQGLMEHGRLHEAMLWLARALELTPGEDGPVQRYARTCLANLEADAPVLRAMWAPKHPGPVAAAAFSADGSAILTGSEATESAPGEARLWDAVTGQPLTEPLPHRGTVTLVAISPDRKALLTASTPQAGQWEVRLWDAATGKPLTDPIASPISVTLAACGAGGKSFLTAGSARPDEPTEARLWSVKGKTAEPRPLAANGSVTAVAVSGDGKTYFTAVSSLSTLGSEMRLWDAATGEPGKKWPLGGMATAAAFAADGTVWVGDDAGGVVAWDVAQGRAQPGLHGTRGSVRGLALSPAGDYALVLSENVQTGKIEVRLWDRYRGQWLGVALPQEAASARAAFSPDGRRALTWDQGRAVRAWDLDYERRWFAAVPVPAPQAGPAFSYRVVQYASDGRSLTSLAQAQSGVSVQLWDAATGTARGEPFLARGSTYMAPDGRTVLIAGARETRFYDAATGKATSPPLGDDAAARRVAFSPDGKTAVLASSQRLWLVEVPGGRPTGPAWPPPGAMTDLRFDPDGKHVWVATLGAVRRYDAATGREDGPAQPVRGRGFHNIVPGPGGKHLAVVDQSGLGLWDMAAGSRTEFSIPRWAIPTALGFTPDGQALLAAEPSGFGAQLWDVGLGKPVGLPIRCPSFFTSASFRPDGRALAVGGGTGVLRLVRLPEPLTDEPDKAIRRVRALAGLELTPAGDVRALDPSEWRAEADEAGADESPAGLGWHLRRGLDREEVGQWDAALWHLDRHLRDRPDDWLARTLRVRALAQLKRFEEAAADFDRSFAKGPAESVVAWYLLAVQQGPLSYDDLVEPGGKPKYTSAAGWLAARLIERGVPQSGRLLLQRAQWLERNRWEEAAKDLERAAKLAPGDADLLLDVGRAFARHKDADRAATYLGKAAAARPDDPTLWLDTARELVRLEKWDAAADHFLRGFDLLPKGRSVNAPRAQVALEVAQSPQVAERAIKLRPDDPYLRAGRARYHVERGEWKEAADDFARAAEAPAVDEPAYEHAAVLRILNDETGYRKAVVRLIERAGDSEDPFEAYVLARTCGLGSQSAAEAARAVGWAERALAERPTAGWYLHVLGLALYRKGDFKGAVARFEESEKSSWVPVLNWLGLALAHHRLDHEDEARKYLDRATEVLDAPGGWSALSSDAVEAPVLRREAEQLIRGK
jgi:serine/threonine protein kinase/WD40 repeat protein/tetratricopeptide (TPR) repeat protein